MTRKRFASSTVGVLLALVMAVGCFPTTVLNTGKVVAQDKFAFTPGIMKMSDPPVGFLVLNFRYGAGENVDVGGGLEAFNLRFDGRYQFLKGEEHFIDAAAELGMGLIMFTLPTYYVGLGISKELGPISPYVHYRWTDLGLLDMTDLEGEDEDNEFIFDSEGWSQIAVGVQVKLGESAAVSAEYAMMDGILSELTGEYLSAVSVGFRFGGF